MVVIKKKDFHVSNAEAQDQSNPNPPLPTKSDAYKEPQNKVTTTTAEKQDAAGGNEHSAMPVADSNNQETKPRSDITQASGGEGQQNKMHKIQQQRQEYQNQERDVDNRFPPAATGNN